MRQLTAVQIVNIALEWQRMLGLVVYPSLADTQSQPQPQILAKRFGVVDCGVRNSMGCLSGQLQLHLLVTYHPPVA